MNEGFGVVIVTVVIRGGGTIVLVDEGDDGTDEQVASWSFPCHAGSAWLLSSHARNKASHGVLADGPNRESLNLRFGLHAADEGGEFSAYEEVDRHWEWGKGADAGRKKSGYA